MEGDIYGVGGDRRFLASLPVSVRSPIEARSLGRETGGRGGRLRCASRGHKSAGIQ